jgi:inner membrane transporter RhtA
MVGAMPALTSILLIVAAMASIQAGAALAKLTLFPAVGAQGTTALRVALAALILLAVWRPWRALPRGAAAGWIVLYGAVMGVMNLLFYMALTTIPLGVAVALEFTGPLAVAIAGSRRRLDFLWILLAAAGVILLLPLGGLTAALDPVGIALALGAGACWALYILFGKRAGAAGTGRSTALGMTVAALIVAPVGYASAGASVLAPALLPAALAVAVLSSALPYSLEMVALRRLPQRTFGILMSLEPALGALSGLILLGERLTVVQSLAIAAVMAASVGSAATARVEAQPPPS